MKKRTLWALLLCLTMLASLLAGCGGEKKETAEDGRGDVIEEEPSSDPGDVIEEEPSSDPGDTLDEPEVNFEDFVGCWEYWDYDIWLYVYGDGTYEMYNADGDSTSGSYTPEGTEIVLDSGERFALDGNGGLIDGEGDGLFASELPDFTNPEPYFEEYEIGINYELGQGDATLEDGAYYFEMNTDGQYYNLGPLVCSVYLESEEDLGNGYVERTVTLYRGFTEKDIPMFTIGVSMGAGYLFYDYYTGFFLPDNDQFAVSDGTHYFEFDTPDGLVELVISVESGSRNDVEGYRNLYAETITVTAPDWYDGLVLSVPTQPDTYDGLNERGEFFTALDGYYPALDLPWDVESALNCLVLW